MSKRNSDKRKYTKTPFRVTILLLVVGFLMAVIFAIVKHSKKDDNDDGPSEWIEIGFSIGVELAASSFVVLVTVIFIGEDKNDKTIDLLYTAVKQSLGDNHKTAYMSMELLNDCIQKKCTTERISDYIMKSKELSGDNGVIELHIMTNELSQYDFTTISTLAIANNVLKDVKYIYYLPDDSLTDFGKLSDRVKSFIIKDRSCMLEIDGWIRERVCQNRNLRESLVKTLVNRKPEEVVADFWRTLAPDKRKSLTGYLKKMSKNSSQRIALPDSFTNWLDGGQGETTIIDDVVNSLNQILSTVKGCNSAQTTQEVQELMKNIEYIAALNELSKYLLNGDKPSGFCVDLIINDNVIEGISQLRYWLLNKTPLSENVIDSIIEKNLVCIDLSKTAIIKPCYSFCLFIQGSGQSSREVSIAWYTCHSGAESNEICSDNFITIYAPEQPAREEKEQMIEMFKLIIKTTPDAEETLTSCGSKLPALFPKKDYLI